MFIRHNDEKKFFKKISKDKINLISGTYFFHTSRGPEKSISLEEVQYLIFFFTDIKCFTYVSIYFM